MSGNGSGRRPSWPTVGQLHTSVRDFFVGRGWGASTLARVEADHPDLLGRRATSSSMNKLVDIENGRVRQGPLLTRGDYLARAATPIRRAVVHGVLANATLGRHGLRGLAENRHGYGRDVLADLFNPF